MGVAHNIIATSAVVNGMMLKSRFNLLCDPLLIIHHYYLFMISSHLIRKRW